MHSFAVVGKQQPDAETTRSPQGSQRVSPGDRGPQLGPQTARTVRRALRPSQVPARPVDTVPSLVADLQGSPGRPLAPAVRAARSLNAEAYTVGALIKRQTVAGHGTGLAANCRQCCRGSDAGARGA